MSDEAKCPTCGDGHLWRLNQGCYGPYLESQNQALQERIAKGKGALTLAVDLMIQAEGHEDYTKAVQAIEYVQAALSPTQETDRDTPRTRPTDA